MKKILPALYNFITSGNFILEIFLQCLPFIIQYNASENIIKFRHNRLF